MRRRSTKLRLRPPADPIVAAIIALLLFSVSLGGLTSVAYADQYVNGGVAWDYDSPPVRYADVNPLGVNTFLEKEVDPDKVERTLQMVRDAGFKWVRQGFLWNDIEVGGKGDYIDRRNPGEPVDAWAKYDRIVELCQKYGLEIIARIDSPPRWARIPGDDVETYHKGPPNDYNDYGDFVAAIAERYKGKVRFFQIWNEPNLHGEWGGHPIDPYEYTRLLRIAYIRAKSANPEAVVLTAALAPTAENSIRNLNDVLFLEGMYQAGAALYFDVLTTMLYGLGQPPTERRTDLKRLNFSRPVLLRQVMEKYGDVNTPIWISEYAWISLPDDFPGDPKKNIWGQSVDEQTQARWLIEGYRRAQSEWPWMGVMSVWYFREPDPRPEEPATYFAIVQPDFTPRPAYQAIQEYSRSLPDQTLGVTEREWARKPLWNAWGFPILYALFGLLTAGSAALGASSLGRWAEAALNRPRGRYSEAVRERARNGAVVVGMALLVALYYWTDSVPLMLAALAGWGILAFFKPSVGLAAVAFSIPFFWYPKWVGQQRFPIAETLLLLVFGAVLARRAVTLLLPKVAARLGIALPEYASPDQPTRQVSDRPLPALPAPSYTGGFANVKHAYDRSLSSWGNGAGEPTVEEPAHEEPALVPTTGQHYDRRIVVKVARVPTRRAVALEEPTPRRDSQPPTPSIRHRLPQTVTADPKSKIQNRGALWATKIIERFKQWSQGDAFAPPAVALLIVGTLSLLTLADPTFARDSARVYRWVIVEPVLLYFLMTEVLTRRRSLLRVADFFVAAAVGVALFGLWQFATDDTLDVQGVSRVFGVYQHPNNLALYLGRVVPFAACMALFLPWGWRKTLYGLGLLPLAVTLYLTYSRGAAAAVLLALLVSIGVGLLWRRSETSILRRKLGWRAWAAIGGALVMVLGVGLAVLLARPDLGSGSLRVLHWRSALSMLADRPLFGVGIDQFLNQFQARQVIEDPEACEKLWAEHPRGYIVDPAQCQEFWTAHPHNLFLDYWLSLGIMGLLVLLWLLWRYFREALLKIQEASSKLGADPVGRAMALGLLASMINFVAHGMVDNSYFLMDLALIFWLSCGMLQLLRVRRETRNVKREY